MQTRQIVQQMEKQLHLDTFLNIENVSKVYPTPNGPYTVLKDVNLTINQG